MTLLAYRYALDPTPAQERALRSHAGAARVAFNWGLARVKANLDQRAAERTYGIPHAELTPSLPWTLYGLRKDWNAAKDTVAPWWRQVSKEAFNTGLYALARALKNWGDSRKGKRNGRPVAFPRFRSRRKARPSIRFTTGAIRCEATHAVLPRLGRIRLHERADLGEARVMSASVRFERGRWHVAYTVEQDVTRPAPTRPGIAVGVDLGIKTLAVGATSTGETLQVPNPRHLTTALRKVHRLCRSVSRRQGPDRRSGQSPSNRWRKADATRNKALGRVAAQRKDGIHKLTSTLLDRCPALRWDAPGLTRGCGAGLTLHSHLRRERRLRVGSASVAVRGTGGQSCEVHRGVGVPVQDGAAGRAGPLTFGEGELGFHRTALRTGLAGREPAVRDDQGAAVPGRLVGELAADLGERGIRDVPGQPAVADHPGDVGVFHHDRPVGGGQGPRATAPPGTLLGWVSLQPADAPPPIWALPTSAAKLAGPVWVGGSSTTPIPRTSKSTWLSPRSSLTGTSSSIGPRTTTIYPGCSSMQLSSSPAAASMLEILVECELC